jgi:hypothetical protein
MFHAFRCHSLTLFHNHFSSGKLRGAVNHMLVQGVSQKEMKLSSWPMMEQVCCPTRCCLSPDAWRPPNSPSAAATGFETGTKTALQASLPCVIQTMHLLFSSAVFLLSSPGRAVADLPDPPGAEGDREVAPCFCSSVGSDSRR